MATGRVSKVKGKVVDIPNPPTIGTATAGGESVSIAFTAYSGGAGGPTRSYIAKSNPGNITATGSTSPINVTGLTAGTSYTISVAGVNETGTGEYSSASGSATALENTAYHSIATATVGSGGAANVEFTSIPSDFKHLQIRAIGKVVNTTAFAKDVLLQFNSDTGNNYSRHQLAGDGSATSAGAGTSTNHIIIGSFPDNYFGSSFFSSFICDILDYTDTNKYTTIKSLGGYEVNNGTYSGSKFASGNWRNTNAVTSIKIYIDDRNIDQYSHFALYGIKGA